MRVLLATTTFYRGNGATTYTLNLADILRANGHEIFFFAMQDERNIPDPNEDLFVSHIDFRHLNDKKSLIGGLNVLKRAIYSSEARSKFGLLLDRCRPDIVHLQSIHHHITPSIIFEAKKRGLPVVWTLHDYKLICPNTSHVIDWKGELCEACGNHSYYKCVLNRCKKGSLSASAMATIEAYAHRMMRVRDKVDAFISPSEFLRSKHIKRGFNPEKIFHVPLFLPPEVFRVSQGDQGYLLFIGRLEPLKGIPELLKACAKVPEVKVKLAGHIAEALVGEIPASLPSNVEYVGVKQGDELVDLLANATAVVLPSLYYENQPFSILEAFACGKPVIASDAGGMTELVDHKKRGLLFTRASVDELAAAMQWMAANPAEVQRMGAAALDYVREQHTGAKHYYRIMDVYEAVTKSKSKVDA